MTIAIYLVLCASLAVFVMATAVRAAWYARAPLHLRWELYPVPHEAPDRAAYGGSHFEQSSTSAAPDRPHHWGTVKALAAGWPGWLLRTLSFLTGTAGLMLTPAGAAALLHRRLTGADLRRSTTPGDLFNLAAFIVALTMLAAGFAFRPAGTAGPRDVAIGLLTWSPTLVVAPLAASGLILSALLAAYIPFTHMSHFVGKYFTYHAVRWDDGANRPGGAIGKAMATYLTYRPSWAATHVGAEGTRTWADIAASAPPTDKAAR